MGVNTKTPLYALDVSGTLNVKSSIGANCVISTSGNDSVVQNNGTGSLFLRASSGGNNGIIVDSAGRVGILTTPNASYSLNVNGNVQANSYNATSDYRIKENIFSLDLSFTVDVLKPVSYNFKNDKDSKLQVGFIAHEVQEFYPFLVNGEKDGKDTQSINYNGFIGILTKEIQDLKKKVSYMEAKALDQAKRIEDQAKRIEDQDKRIEDQEAKALDQAKRIEALDQSTKALEKLVSTLINK